MSIYQKRTEGNQDNQDSSTHTTNRTNSLDPHLSIYELLERSNNLIVHSEENSTMEHHNQENSEDNTTFEQSSSLQNVSINPFNSLIKEVPLTLKDVTHNKKEEKLPESWLNIQRNDITNSLHVETSNSQTNTAGILSSSDTSEEELDTQNSPSPQKMPIVRQNKDNMTNKNMIQCVNDNYHRDLNVNPHFVTGNISKTTLTSIGFKQINEEDSVTLTKSISSSGSYVMPKLSISRKNGQQLSEREENKSFRILVLGRIGLQFYRSIPQKYQYLLSLPRTYDSNEYCNYNGIIIVIEEISELMSILNRISKKVMDSLPVAAVTPESDNLLQIKNVISSYVKRKLISTMYTPIVMTNTIEVTNLFQILCQLEQDFINQQKIMLKEQKLSNSSLYAYISHSSSDASDSSDSLSFSTSNKRLKKMQYQNGNQINEYILSHQESNAPFAKKKKK
ncbi:mitophagy protein atg32 [Maudiozyma exigua]|uniref:Mitophagy protein atg32 n=1 Tax=Maudiozyma exigua TaxID=34358 RepID=A0A9P7BCZ9_MAUEX|nr:mitophagy protein atg32 [Kazachstania exigua]